MAKNRNRTGIANRDPIVGKQILIENRNIHPDEGFDMVHVNEVSNLMDGYAAQFRYIYTTDGDEILFDDCDYHVLRSHTLFLTTQRNVVHTTCKSSKGKSTSCPIAKIMLKANTRDCIYYRDGNPLNLRRSNIQVVARRTANYGQKRPKSNTSGYKGVSWNKHAKKYSASIRVNRKSKFLGYYARKMDAAMAYNSAAKKYFGADFAKLNNVAPHAKTKHL